MLLQEAYDDGAYLVRQGEPGNNMYVVQSGDVIATHRVTGEAGDGQEVGLFELCMRESGSLQKPTWLCNKSFSMIWFAGTEALPCIAQCFTCPYI